MPAKLSEIAERFGVTGEQLDAWADEYESADWSQMRFGEVIKGRPKFSDEPLDSVADAKATGEAEERRRIASMG